MPPRIAPIIAERDARLLVMAGYLPSNHALATKTVAISPATRPWESPPIRR